ALGELGDLVDLARRGPDAQHDAQREAERAGVDLGVVAADHAALFEAREPLRHRRRRQPDEAPERRVALARIALQLLDQTEICAVELSIRKLRWHHAFDRHCTGCEVATTIPGSAPPAPPRLLRRQRGLPLPR